MSYGRRGRAMNKFDYAATLAASLAALCVKQRDAVGLAGRRTIEPRLASPRGHAAAAPKIIDALENAQPGSSDRSWAA